MISRECFGIYIFTFGRWRETYVFLSQIFKARIILLFISLYVDNWTWENLLSPWFIPKTVVFSKSGFFNLSMTQHHTKGRRYHLKTRSSQPAVAFIIFLNLPITEDAEEVTEKPAMSHFLKSIGYRWITIEWGRHNWSNY